jgi:hypothetical protein
LIHVHPVALERRHETPGGQRRAGDLRRVGLIHRDRLVSEQTTNLPSGNGHLPVITIRRAPIHQIAWAPSGR